MNQLMTDDFGWETGEYPDPFLTAAVYCSANLDRALVQVASPVRDFLRLHVQGGSYLWTMRYGRGGEHLKLRLHGPEPPAETLEAIRAQIEDRAAGFFASLPEPSPDEPRRTSGHALPIDVEDEAEEPPPDRHLLWTQYRRSHVSLAGPPFLEDDRYVALFTRCLGVGCEMVLSVLGEEGEASHQQRQSALFKTLVAGLAQLDLEPDQRCRFLIYHRDWLVRFPILKQRGEPEKVDRMLERLEAQSAARPQVLETLAKVAEGAWAEPPEMDGKNLLDLWGLGLARLLDHVRTFEGHPGYRLDPFAPDPAFVPLFKVLHGFANQLGLTPLNEALAYHLLLRAVAGDEIGRKIDLLPPSLEEPTPEEVADAR